MEKPKSQQGRSKFWVERCSPSLQAGEDLSTSWDRSAPLQHALLDGACGRAPGVGRILGLAISTLRVALSSTKHSSGRRVHVFGLFRSFSAVAA